MEDNSLAGYRQLSLREKYIRQREALINRRSSWMSHWEDISKYFSPRMGMFLDRGTQNKQNRGNIRHNNIYDSTPLFARRVLAAGLMSGLTSPARPWFRLKLPDQQLMEDKAVQLWLKQVTDLMQDVFRASNTYRVLPTVYSELSTFGTHLTFMEPDFENIIRLFPSTIGEFCIAENERNKVDTVFRMFDLSVGQIVKRFGIENVSQVVKRAYQEGNYYQDIPVTHAVKPREDRNQQSRRPDQMPYASCWFENASERPDQLLRNSGYERFPALAPRWLQEANDVYGSSPAMEALGDDKQLMHEQFKKAQGLDYQVNPPLQVPTALKNDEVQRFPGGVIYVDPAAQGQAVKSAYDVNLRLDHLLLDIQDIRERINRAFFVDLFLMIAQVDRSNVTAREIAEKQEEKLLMLGPVLQALDDELLEPLVDYTFERLVVTGVLPPPPPQLNGMPLSIEFIGVLAQAQRAVGISAVDRLIGTITAVAQIKPEVLDKIDGDQLVDVYSDMLGVDPSIIIADDKVAIVRQQRAQQAEQQMSIENAKPMADAMKTLSETDPEKPSVLNAV